MKALRNVTAFAIAFVMVFGITQWLHLEVGKYETGCMYMLLYLCINEVLKEDH